MSQQHKKTLIVGLGNPGKKYSQSRHNAGFIFVDKYREFLDESTSTQACELLRSDKEKLLYRHPELEILLLKPLTYMNNSGEVIRRVSKYSNVEVENIVIAYDDLDLKLGKYKITRGSHPKKHNGVLSSIDHLGQTNFLNVRIGVDNRETDDMRIPGDKYVLLKMRTEELNTLTATITEAIVAVHDLIITESSL